MKHNLFFVRRLLRMLETFYTLTALVFFVELFFVKSEESGPYVCAGTFALCALSYVVREFFTRGIYTVIAHAFFMTVCFLLPFSLGDSIVLMIVAVLLCGGALSYLGRGCTLKPYNEAPWEKILIAVVVHLMGIYLESALLMNISYACTLLIFVNYLIVLYVDGIEKYMESTRDVTGVPVKSMLKSNTYIVGFLVIVMTLGMLLGQVIDMSESVNAVRKLIVSIVKIVYYFFKYLFISFLFLIGQLNDDQAEAGKTALQAAETEAGSLVQIIEFIIRLGVITFFAVIAVKLLIRFVKWLMLKQVRYGDVVESLSVGKLKDKGDKDDGAKRIFGLIRTPEETARRAYKLRIMRHRDTFLPDKTMTCGDIKDEIDRQELDNIDELSALYEQVRYGEKPCDRATAKKMTALSRM